MKNIVYFDLETQKSVAEVGGWHNAAAMKMSLGVTYSTERGGYHVYAEQDAQELVQELQRADLVVGYNVIKFDYTVLQPYTVFDFTQVPTLDLMLSIEEKIGRRIGLDAVAKASFGVGKTAVGTDALKWWKEGKVLEIAEYCCYDVKTTRLVHEYGAINGKVFYENTKTKLREEIPVAWEASA
jgi:DEAD/DEAH box helicase domain-containing protein